MKEFKAAVLRYAKLPPTQSEQVNNVIEKLYKKGIYTPKEVAAQIKSKSLFIPEFQ